MNKLPETLEHEFVLSATTQELISSIRTAVLIHQQLFLRVISGAEQNSPILVELLEDVGNIYLDYSESLSRTLYSAKVK